METKRKNKIETRDLDGKVIRRHRTAWAAWEFCQKKNNRIPYCNDWIIRHSTTADIVWGNLSIAQVIEPHNHRQLKNGSIVTRCDDGPDEYTRINDKGQIDEWYFVLHI